MKRKIIIGLAGKANSGKDTAASIINYIYKKGMSSACYGDWLLKRKNYEYNLNLKNIHFADNLKDIISILYNINRDYLNNRKYKDELWYSFNEKIFITDKQLDLYKKITISELKDNSLKNILKNNNKCCIKLRTILQYFGNDICKECLSENIWIDSTLYKAQDIANNYDLCLISDVRFQNEVDAIHRLSTFNIVIKLNRTNVNKIEHESEELNISCDYEINNNDSLQKLFYSILELLQKL